MKPTLGHLRFPVSHARGRRYPELLHPYRNEFQRDRDRIVHARAFRRLEDKTQVFPPGISDHFRNRLTHTIEVSQIARTAAAVLDLDEDFTEALALAHDLGHPPFGHAGEQELNRQMRKYGDRFDHNLHALRIVETFEQRYARFPGLNLTFEVREGMAKHSRDFKAGQFPMLDEYLPGQKPPVEAQLIDPADEIAYNTADLDDGYTARLFSVDDVCAAVPEFAEVWNKMEFQFPGAPEKVRFSEAVRGLIDTLVSGLIEGTSQSARQAGLETVGDVRHHSSRVARLTPPAEATNAALKSFLQRKVYQSGVVLRERQASAGMITALFEAFMKDPEKLPEPYVDQATEDSVHRVVCDYIAGMTDGFLRRTYDQMI
ncbi:MAG: dNTP triphosphohydrolase [Bryobacteraceae bacterium]|nr:dNTP triphosphohydrolase [Bryobacterales bacterium]MEB2364081.1 dNTP triphosphohydrolase [Bryobacterales bacterium]NUN02241.1 dNTP triphosphohydrolase [Bryobacteraceae bacterium]